MLKIISGGQTGADMGGLEAAKQLGFEVGGWAAPSYMTETGPQPELLKSFNLVAVGYASGTRGTYTERTRRNILDADLTVVFAHQKRSAGTNSTITMCLRFNKPILVNPTQEELLNYIKENNPTVINIAGNRESVAPGIQDEVKEFMLEVLKCLGNQEKPE